MQKTILTTVLLLLFCLPSIAQLDTSQVHFLDPAPTLHKGRTIGVSSVLGGGYTLSMIGLNELWYKNHPRSKFHFFNDNGEWMQIDKVGHAWSAYAEGLYGIGLYRWAGVEDKKAVWIGGMSGFVFQMGIEVLDGFSERWGASSGDIIANTAGTVLVIGQELGWQDQRIQFKFSSHPVSYTRFDQAVQTRIQDLYGTTFQEKILKDYNGQTYWLSVNPSSFFKKDRKFPKWLNIAIGYGAEDIFGGFDNTWEIEDTGQQFDYTHIERYRQFYLSFDIDLTRIDTRSRFLKRLFEALSILKIPAPTIELNTKGKVRLYPVYW